jgi:hypothetical protein
MGRKIDINYIRDSRDTRVNQVIFYYEMIAFLGGNWDIPIGYYALNLLDKKKEYYEYAKGIAKHIKKAKPEYQFGYGYCMLRAKSVIFYAEYIRDTLFLNAEEKQLEYKNFLRKMKKARRELLI